MQRRKTVMTTAIAGLVLTGAVAAGAPSYAADSPSPSPSASADAKAKNPKHDGAKALCKRVPKLEKRIHKNITRLRAGAGARGSVAFLEQRIDRAKKDGHTAVATFLGDRLTTRKTLLPLLKEKQTDLKDVATWCAANNNGKAAKASPAS